MSATIAVWNATHFSLSLALISSKPDAATHRRLANTRAVSLSGSVIVVVCAPIVIVIVGFASMVVLSPVLLNSSVTVFIFVVQCFV